MMLSYDDVPQVREIYKNKRLRNLSVRYKANIRKCANELLYFSDYLNIPKVASLD
jgi:hypothetical protein